jgi:hypothetical protein
VGASCYLCELNMAVFPSEQAGDAVGACKLCGVLACSGHAKRNRNGPLYECGICKPNVLAAAAANQLPPAAPRAAPVPPSPGGPSGGVTPGGGYAQRAATVEDVGDVIDDIDDDRWQALRDDIAYLGRFMAGADMPKALRSYALNERSRRLLAAAAALATRLEMPASEMTPLLAAATEAVQIGAQR